MSFRNTEGAKTIKTYTTNAVCSRKITFDTSNNIVSNVRFEGGCPGNLQAIAALVEGMPVDDVIKRLKGIKCADKPTSCADQLVRALEELEANR